MLFGVANVRPSSDYIAHLDGYTVIPGGWLNSHYIQLGYQLADSVSGGAYSFFGTCLILGALDFLGKFVPVLKLRVSDEEEILGLDDVEIGEFAVSLVFYLSVLSFVFFLLLRLDFWLIETLVRLRRTHARSRHPG